MGETYPIRINGEKKGTLTVSLEGLTTRFDARCEDPGTLVRLSVYGGGKEGYLGVMTPENGALTLHRRLSRAALSEFPAEIEYAGEAGRPAPVPEKKPERPPERKPEPVQSAPAKPRERSPDILWRDAGDGSLYAVVKNQPYRAIPMAAWGLPTERMVEKRTIEGVEYAIFALKDGRIL